MTVAIEIRAAGWREGDGWCGCIEVPALRAQLCARVGDAEVRALVGALRAAHRALHSAERAEIERAYAAQRGEVGILPIIAAVAIPLITAGVTAGVQASQRASTGRPSGLTLTTFTGNPLAEVPRASGPSIEDVRAYWSERGADAPDVVVPRETSPDGLSFGGYTIPNPQRAARQNDLEWLGAYLRGHGLPVYQRAVDVPATVRQAWEWARVNRQPLSAAVGQTVPESPVPIGQALIGSSLTSGYESAPAPWAAGASSTDTTARDVLSVVGTVAQGVATAYGGPAAGAAVGTAMGALQGAIGTGGSPQAVQQVFGGALQGAAGLLPWLNAQRTTPATQGTTPATQGTTPATQGLQQLLAGVLGGGGSQAPAQGLQQLLAGLASGQTGASPQTGALMGAAGLLGGLQQQLGGQTPTATAGASILDTILRGASGSGQTGALHQLAGLASRQTGAADPWSQGLGMVSNLLGWR